MSRHDFRAPDKRLLAERVGFHCSNPSCGVATIGPSNEPNEKEYVGVAAHIYSASINNGPRANPSLTEEERSSIRNGIHLCNKCSTIIDKNNGSGYPAEILFNWKLSAEAAAKARVYNNNSYTLFRRVDFSNLEQQYSTALTCSSLNDKNVVSCPVNRIIITDITNKLLLANKCVLKGCSGSGKSLLTYQAAYELHKNGWSIFNLGKDLITDNSVFVAPLKKSLIVIDDAQIIEHRHLERILSSSHSDCFVLANWNSSTSFDSKFLRGFPCVDVVPSSQVELLKSYCLNNKKELSNLLKSIGITLNNKNHYSRIETRIDMASKEATPWLFNYHLTEGWNTANDDLKLLRDNENMNLVVVTVAAYQFATLDYGVNEEVIISSLKTFRNEPLWIDKARDNMEEYCHIEDGLVKNKHYEYSRKVLKIFTSQKDCKEEHLYLIGVLKEILNSSYYEKGHSNILEFIMFDFKWCAYELNRKGFMECSAIELFSSGQEAQASLANISKLNSLIRFNKDVLGVLELNKSTFEKWIFSCSRDTAYALGDLFNTLYNEKYSHFPSSRTLIDYLFKITVSSDIDDTPRFSYMLNRSHMLLSDNDKEYISDVLSNADFNLNISSYSTSTACYQFSSLIHDFSCINYNWANQQVQNNIDGIADLLNNNLMEAYRDFKELIDSYFGVIGAILQIKNTSSELTKRGKELSNKIHIDTILKGFEMVEVVDVQDYSNILIFVALYDKSKLNEISNRFNYTRLERLYGRDKKLDHYHRGVIGLLHNPDSANYMNYLSKVIISSDCINKFFVGLNLDLSIEQLNKGIKYKIKFHDGSECEKELLILEYIKKEVSVELAKSILLENESEISKSIHSKSQNVDNKNGKFYFLLFVYENSPGIFKVVFSDQEKNNELMMKIKRLLKGNKHEKNISRFYIYLIKKYAIKAPSEIHDIEKRYSSVRKFNIDEYIS